ncbi:alanine racemase [Azospirillum lipoferum]|uniref:alanine racemase n=1 Tax=Azospirillum lipoferum TaxID=193 RepID=A0A5A9G3U7_AZOLI|nr:MULTISPECIES: alanine racemase [Azospirillum]KAA0588947.1 alanine racemase [Azospirillum lipoferum]MCP1615173.1 alanine racemase [Azospirillum lipoferum]MDW5537034.1 alanine racemase [Azospirillum sp. NL1]
MTNDVAGCHAVLHLDRLAANLAMARSILGTGGRILGVVKANAYGHGALAVSRALERAGIDGLAVDSLDEGMDLRREGIASPILVMNPLCPGDASPMIAAGLTATVSDAEAAEALQSAARRAGRPAGVHVRVRSDGAGLGADRGDVAFLLRRVRGFANLRLDGLFTHMIGPYRDDPVQIGREVAGFRTLIDRLPADVPKPPFVHAVTSPGLFNAPGARFDMVRLGAVLYGIRMVEAGGAPFPFRPVMELVSRVAHLCRLEPGDDIGYSPGARRRNEGRSGGRAAMIPVGYADLPFLLRFRDSAVLIRGRRAPLIGEAFMGKVLADVTDIPEAALGDEAVFVGTQGIETITVEDIGKANGIRPSAILMLGPRVARRSVGQVGGEE